MQTNTIPLSSPTRKAGSRTLSRSRSSKPRASGTAASCPSWRYVQPWYAQHLRAAALAVQDAGRPVPADVRERAQLAVLVAQHGDRLARDRGRPEPPRLRHVADVTGEVPRLQEHLAHLRLVHLGRRVPPRRQCLALRVGHAHTLLLAVVGRPSSIASALLISSAARSWLVMPDRICSPSPSTVAASRIATSLTTIASPIDPSSRACSSRSVICSIHEADERRTLSARRSSKIALRHISTHSTQSSRKTASAPA